MEAPKQNINHQEASNLDEQGPPDITVAYADLDEKGIAEDRPQGVTFKHAIVLVSLTLLYLSAAAPFFLILSSICILFPGITLFLSDDFSFCCPRHWGGNN
jgi:hypothetical protein